jgi:hypothetical protein
MFSKDETVWSLFIHAAGFIECDPTRIPDIEHHQET